MDDSYPLPPRLAAILQDLPLEQLAFTPVPVRARYDGWTPARQVAFIHRLALCGSASTAARAVGVTRKSAYRLRARAGAESFAAAWDAALGMGRSSRLDHAIECAIAGEVRPVFYRGRKCGEQVRHNHGLTIAVLNLMDRERPGKGWARRPEASGDY
jgi:hypothetical protein